MRRRNVIAIAILIAALGANRAEAQDARIIEARAEGIVTYDPFEGLPGLGTIQVRIHPEDGAQGPVLVMFEPADAGTFALRGPGNDLEFEIDLPRRQSPAGFAAPSGQATLQPDETTRFAATVMIPESQYAEPGIYTRNIDVVLADAATNQEIARYEDVPVEVRVPSRAQVNIAGASGAFDFASSVPFIDFGTLETNERRDVFVQVRANAMTEITVSSEHSGHLRHVEKPDMYGAPYSIVFDGEASQLETPLRTSRRPPASLAGASYPLAITIGEVSGLPAGEYRDYLLVEVRPQ